MGIKHIHKAMLLMVAILVMAATAWADPPKDNLPPDGGGWGFKRITNADPNLPRVLLIGDSIANGYHKRVAELLKGKANVDLYITPKNVRSPKVLEDLRAALAHGPYRVIHFNESGLHAWQKNAIAEGQYGPLFAKYLKDLQEHAGNAVLIWATSTPVTIQGKPGELDVEVDATVTAHNDAARKIVEDQKIAVDDLHALMSDKLKLARGDRFHWTAAGSNLQADAVVQAVQKVLHPQ